MKKLDLFDVIGIVGVGALCAGVYILCGAGVTLVTFGVIMIVLSVLGAKKGA